MNEYDSVAKAIGSVLMWGPSIPIFILAGTYWVCKKVKRVLT